MLLGFIITALAVSLGSNFWFDLLKKLVSIRGSGTNPDEAKLQLKKEVVAPLPDTSSPGGRMDTELKHSQKTEDPLDIAIRIYGDEIKSNKGVISIGKGYFRSAEGMAVSDRLQVYVCDEDTAVRIRSNFSRLRVSESEFIDVDILITGKPRILNGPASSATNIDKGIANANVLFGWGSFGCLVRNKYQPAQKYVLSCYHVMNGNYTWRNDGASRKVQNSSRMISEYFLPPGRYIPIFISPDLQSPITDIDTDFADFSTSNV